MDIVFGKNWFEKYQHRLLWLLNTPIVKKWFRKVMRIKQGEVINRITPSSISYGVEIEGDELRVTTDFRTHDKYSKRLYYAFRPLWYLMHTWDLFADEFVPKLSFGFATLTVYPDAHPETTSVDGIVRNFTGAGSGLSWANMRAAAGDAADDTATEGEYFSWTDDASAIKWKTMRRSIFLFDTSALTAGATISAATMSLFGKLKQDNYSATPNINIYTSTPATNTALVAGDYAQTGTTAQCDTAVTYAGFSTSAYNDFAFNATGLGNISKTAVSKFAAKNANYDVANVAPATGSGDQATYLYGYFADNSGTTNDPKLVITYSVVVGPANLKTYNTNAAANIKTINTNPIANVKTLDTNV